MAGRDTISSTEKLLDVIRGDETEADGGDDLVAESPKRKKTVSAGFGRGATVGVDIGYTGLRLAKAGRKRQLQDFKFVPFGPDIGPGHPRFPQFLKSALSGFCPRESEIWSVIPSAEVEMRYLRVPKLARKEVPNAVFWSLKKETPFNEKEVVFDFDLLGDVIEDGFRKTEVMAYTAPIKQVEELRNTFNRSGFPLTGVTAVPFAFQNLFRSEWLEGRKAHVCNLYIGRTWSRIDVFANGNLVLSRGIKAGLNSMIDAIRDGINERLTRESGGIVIEMEGVEKEEAGAPSDALNDDQTRAVFQALIIEARKTVEAAPGVTIAELEAFDLILPALDRLVRQVERTLEHYTQKLKGETVSRIYSTGTASASARILGYIGEQLAVPVEAVDPLEIKAPLGTMAGAAIPKSIAERSSYAPALGLALSDKAYTPNFIFTYKDKEEVATTKNVRRVALVVFLIVMIILGGYYFFQERLLNQKTARVKTLQTELGKFVPNVNHDLIGKVMAVLVRNRKLLDEYGYKYQGLAVLSEVTGMTPANIRLMSITADLGQAPALAPAAAGPGPAPAQSQKKTVSLEGLVTGDRTTLEPALAHYLLGFQVSPLFGQPSIKEQSFKVLQGREVLFFKAELEVK
ncbi:MAG: hypothetical protein AB1641_28465 [Thermodesulfobacteriota bacterium]